MVEIAKGAGFCFGVKRATDALEAEIAKRSGERLFTLGKLIHNDVYNRQLKESGVGIVSVEDIPTLAESATESSPVCVFIRAHGIPREDEATLIRESKKNPAFRYVDCTCPFVKKIHRIAAEHSHKDNLSLIHI